MIKLVNNELHLNDGTYYDLNKTSKKRVMQGLNHQLKETSITKEDYVKCVNLLDSITTQEMLEEAIKHFGTGDIVTIMLSQKRDKEVSKEQQKSYKAYKEQRYVSTVCN